MCIVSLHRSQHFRTGIILYIPNQWHKVVYTTDVQLIIVSSLISPSVSGNYKDHGLEGLLFISSVILGLIPKFLFRHLYLPHEVGKNA